MSLLEYVPIISDIQSKYDVLKAQDWIYNNWTLVIPIAVLYVLLVHSGQKWMESKPAYDLHRTLFLWNVGLAVFSIFGALSIVPNLVHHIYKNGFKQSVCITTTKYDPHINIWLLFFALSKIIELGDTAFIVLRKSRLQFLHWYHHMTILLIPWYSYSQSGANPTIQWLGAMNYSVHSFMYSYYALKAVGVKVPIQVAKSITIIQLIQMFMGLLITLVTYKTYVINKEECDVKISVIYVGLGAYGSYALLFMYYYYRRYIRSKNKK